MLQNGFVKTLARADFAAGHDPEYTARDAVFVLSRSQSRGFENIGNVLYLCAADNALAVVAEGVRRNVGALVTAVDLASMEVIYTVEHPFRGVEIVIVLPKRVEAEIACYRRFEIVGLRAFHVGEPALERPAFGCGVGRFRKFAVFIDLDRLYLRAVVVHDERNGELRSRGG